jgi:alkylation response protein AidB-like acyl-CoA dehydrogenase
MDVGLTSEQLALRDTVRDILRTECPPEAARQALTDPERWRPLWKTVVDLGWTELAAPDASGDFGPVELTVVLEEAGAAIAPIPLLSSVGLAAGVLRACGPALDPALGEVLAEIAGGTVATLAAHSSAPGPSGRLPGATMTLHNGRLRGRAVAVPNLSRAELVVTLATSEDGVMVAVARCGDGVRILAGESTDPAQPVADVEIDTEPVAIAPVEIEAALTAPLVAAAADLVGVASAALHRAVEHAKARRQFGSPIGGFQGIKHALADNYVSVERARGLTYAAAARLGEPGSAPAPWDAALLAKAAAADAAVNCARTAVQVHGALGQTWEHDIHLYVRHAWQGAAMLGDSRALYHEAGRRFAGGAA